jgi:hypothetical protein
VDDNIRHGSMVRVHACSSCRKDEPRSVRTNQTRDRESRLRRIPN